MNVKKFDSSAVYEAWTNTFDNVADYQMIPVIIDDGWKVSIDLFTECKRASTAISRFVRTFSEYFPDVKNWGEGMLESVKSGYWHSTSNGGQDAKEEIRISRTFGAFSWGVEETGDGLWYIYLNVSGEYAGRGQKAPADRYLEQVAQADSLDELDSITETAANDDTLTGAEYEAVHAAALRKAQEWDPQNQREKPASRPMYKTIPEALAIFDGLYSMTLHRGPAVLIVLGEVEIPESVLWDVETTSMGVTIKKSRFSSCDPAAMQAVRKYIQSTGARVYVDAKQKH